MRFMHEMSVTEYDIMFSNTLNKTVDTYVHKFLLINTFQKKELHIVLTSFP